MSAAARRSRPGRRLIAAACSLAVALLPASPAPAQTIDPLLDGQWGLKSIQAEKAWTLSRGAGVTVAVLDTGIDLKHPDLASKLVVAQGSNLSCGRKARKCDPNNPQDDHGHGTHVAGIAAAITGNGTGVAGAAPDAKLLPVKVLDSSGSGSVDQIAAGIRFAADQGAKVLNLSLGELPGVHFIPRINDPIDRAIAYAWSKGSLIVAAAGNDGAPLCSYPAADERVVCVGAVDRYDLKTFYSNFGLGIAVVAPGGIGSVFCHDDNDIWSTYAVSEDTQCTKGAPAGYETLAGTSMATPFVSGVAALLAATGLPAQGVIDRLRRYSDDLGVPGQDPVYGFGRVNAFRALNSS